MNCPACGKNNAHGAVCAACGAALTDAAGGGASFSAALKPGTKLHNGAFTIGQVLGQGGFGITYKGGDMSLRRFVAIKEFFPGGCERQTLTVAPTGGAAQNFADIKTRFLEEAQTLARFNHPSIVRVFSVFEENNTAYMVMEFLEGQTLHARIAQGVLPEREVVEIAGKIGGALQIVHAANIIHRDIKPDNIFLTNDGRAALIDFGTARAFASNQTVRHTALLTPGYAPLEQYGSQARFGIPADIYALGATLYHALTGQMPAPATDRASGVEVPAPETVNPHLTPHVSRAIVWATQLKADARPQTVQAFIEALKGAPISNASAPSTPGPAFPAAPAGWPAAPQPFPPQSHAPTQVVSPNTAWPGANNSPPPLHAPTQVLSPGAPAPNVSPGALWIQANGEGQILTNADPYRALESLAAAMRAYKINNVTPDARTLQVRGNSGMGLATWGHQISGQIIPGANGTAIVIRSQSSTPVVTDWGKGKNDAREIFRLLEIKMRADANITSPSPAPSTPGPPPNYPGQSYPPQSYPPQNYQGPNYPPPIPVPGHLPPAPGPYVQSGQGSGVLTMGIIGLFCCTFLAPVAWVMGNNALAAYGDQDPGDRATVQAGRVMGIIGTCFLGVVVLMWILGALGS